MAKGEILTLGAAAGAIGGVYKLGEFLLRAKRIRDVGPSNAVYVRIIGRVRSDLDEVKRLLSVREVHDALEGNKEKSKWVYGAMRDVRGALENMAPHTERVASDVDDGRRVGIRHGVYWLTSEKEKLENREKELQIAHTSLSEVLGYLSALEPVEEPHKPKSKTKSDKDKNETHIDIEIKRDAPHHTTETIERDVWIDREPAPPRRLEEHRDVYIERDIRGPPAHYEEHRDVYHDERHRGPQHYDDRGPQHYDDYPPPPPPQHYDERDMHRGRDPRYEAQYDERYEQQDHYPRRPQYPEERYPDERPHDNRPFPPPLGRRPECYDDRHPEHRQPPPPPEQYGPPGQYAEYGAPQPIGAANYHLPLDRRSAEREVWIEQKEDYRFDEYGNRLPDRYFQQPTPVPRPYRTNM